MPDFLNFPPMSDLEIDALDMPGGFPSQPPEPPAIGDCRFLEVIHIFDTEEETSTALCTLVSKAHYHEVYDVESHDLLKQCGGMIAERYLERLLEDPHYYGFGTVMTNHGWRFVYVGIQWMPTPSMARN